MLPRAEAGGAIRRRLISVVAFLMTAGTGGASALQGQEILATGDSITGLGHVGLASVETLGIDDAGRLLIGGGLATGDSGLFWINNGATTPLWLHSQSNPPVWLHTDAYSVSMSDSGSVAALGNEAPPTNCSFCFSSIYRVRTEGVERIVSIGEYDAEGNRLCSFSQPGLQINDSGEIAFLVDVAPPGFGCRCQGDDSDYWCPPAALYVTSGGQLHRVAGTNELSPPGQRFSDIWVIGLTRNGAAIFVADGTRVMAAGGTWVYELVSKGDRGPSGSALGPLDWVSANSLGEVAFLSSENGNMSVYRTTGGGIVRVIPAGDVTPAGAPLYLPGFSSPFLNDRGDVAVNAEWLTTAADGYQSYAEGVLWYPADGNPSVVLTGGIGLASNNVGDLVVAPYSYEGRPAELLRWHDGQAEHIFGAGDTTPAGALFAEGGIEPPMCLAPNGLAAVTALSLEDDRRGFACVDNAGPHLIAKSGDMAPGDGTLGGFYQCAFADDGAIFFASPVYVQTDPHTYTYSGDFTVYRATGQAVERFIGPGDVATDGTRLDGLSFVYDNRNPPTCFASNLHGTVVVQGSTNSGIGLFRRRVGQPLEHLAIAAAGITVNRYSTIKALGVLDDDTVAVLLFSFDDYRTSPILLIDSNGTQSLAPAAGSLIASGDRITFAGANWPEDPIFAYHASDDRLEPLDLLVPPGIVSLGVPSFVAAAPNGNLIFGASFQDSGLSGGGGYFLLDGDTVQLLSKTSEVGYTTPTGLNDRGNLLVQGYSPRTGGRQVLQLTGPPATGACPAANGTPRPAPTSPPTLWPTATPTPPFAVPTCAGDCPTLQAGSETGLPGQQVTVAVSLRTDGAAIVATQNDLSVDTSALSVVRCQVNPGIDKPDSAFALYPKGCTPGVDCRSLRALVFSLDIGNPIADGAIMYTCVFAIAADAAPGRYPVHVSNVLGGDPGGHPIPLAGADGEIQVDSARAASGIAGATSRGRTTGGCAIAATSEPARSGIPFALLPWMWVLAGRWRRATRGRSAACVLAPGRAQAVHRP